MIEKIINEIFVFRYDIYEFGYKFCYLNGEEKSNSFARNVITGNEVLLQFLRQKKVTSYLCNKCFKRKVVETIEFVKLYASEDSCDLLQIFSKATSYCSLDFVAYNYMQSENSLCRSIVQVRHFDAIRANEFKIKYLTENNKKEYCSYVYVQAASLCAFLYGRFSTSDIDNKKYYLRKLKDDFKFYKKRIKYSSDAFRIASKKRKLAIIVFPIAPWIFKYVTK